MQQWLRPGPEALKNWLLEPKTEAVQDQALAAYSRLLFRTDPQEGAAWAAQIKDVRWSPHAYGGAASN